jgi:hypothetical protein
VSGIKREFVGKGLFTFDLPVGHNSFYLRLTEKPMDDENRKPNEELTPILERLPAPISARVPALFGEAGTNAWERVIEFFTARLRNPNTRMAYVHAVTQFALLRTKNARKRLNRIVAEFARIPMHEIWRNSCEIPPHTDFASGSKLKA